MLIMVETIEPHICKAFDSVGLPFLAIDLYDGIASWLWM